MTEEKEIRFAENLMGLLNTIIDHLHTHDEAIKKLIARDDELEHHIDLLFDKEDNNEQG